MKKSTTILTIISTLLTIAAAVLLLLSPVMLGDAGYMGATDFGGAFNLIIKNFGSQNALLFNPQFYSQTTTEGFPILFLLPILLGLLAILWLIHLIVLFAKKRPGIFFLNLFLLILGFLSFEVIFMFLAPGWFSISDNALSLIFGDASKLDMPKKILAILPYAIACFGFALTLIDFIVSMATLKKKEVIEEDDEDVDDEESDENEEDTEELEDASTDEEVEEPAKEIPETAVAAPAIATATAPVKAEANKEDKTASNAPDFAGIKPTFVQYIYNNGSSEGKKDHDFMTKEEVRAAIREEIAASVKADTNDEQKEEIASDEEILTSDDLRAIIEEEIEKAKNKSLPKEEPVEETSSDTLTSDDLRKIISDELVKAGLKDGSGEEIQEPAKEDDEAVLTSDDLRKIIAEEIEKSKEDDIPVEIVADEEENADNPSEKEETLTSDDLRNIIAEEIQKSKDDEKAPQKVEEAVAEEKKEDALTTENLRKIIAEEIEKAIGPSKEEIKEEPAEVEEEPIATTDDLRSIIREELNSQAENTAPEVEEEKEEEKPLTASDLRSLIQEALDEHDNPERRELTEDEARELIVQQIRSYYIGKREDEKRDSEAVKMQKAAEEKAKDEEEKRLALEKALQDEVSARAKEREERAIDRQERLEAEKNRESVSLDDIRNIVRAELGDLKASAKEETSKEDIKELIQGELSAFREEQAKASAKAAQEASDAHVIEQARAEAEAEESKAQSEQIKAQSEEIKNLKENAITGEDVRLIIAEELDKRFAELLKAQEELSQKAAQVAPAPVQEEKEEETPTPTETIVINVAPQEEKEEAKEETKEEPVAPTETEEEAEAPIEDEPEAEEVAPVASEAVAKPKIIRIPFNERMLSADKETQDNYNELKAECLSYGLKSRLSNSGDTFRLHTKTYVKITIAGKGLKLYYALSPKDYENSPIPLHDAGNKNIYKEIPGVFKVKSALSLRRAKQLLADACEKDNLEQGKIVLQDYASELKDYVPQLGGKKEENED